ncbi:NUDIX domain-containing protein [Candidatus Gracilibacteria bacterium]|nr:NUDIX domain-containing protein [Candidatus Gracilibacteria bacterium]
MRNIICLDKDGNSFEAPTSELRFCPSVYGVIIQDGKILLIPQHGDGYGLPGGRIELGESIEAALVREVKEETGYDIEMGGLLDCQSSFFRTNTSKRHIQSILLFYAATVVGGKLSIDGLEEGEKAWMGMAEWVDIDRLPELKFYGSVDIVKIIQSALAIGQ